jgi:hypothetical protein
MPHVRRAGEGLPESPLLYNIYYPGRREPKKLIENSFRRQRREQLLLIRIHVHDLVFYYILYGHINITKV